MPSALDVANYFLSIQEQESDITDLKLQKLCTYAQAFSLAALGRPLFEEDVQAWTHGPVIESLYKAYSRYGNQVIPASGMSEKYAREPFDDEQKFILEIIKNNHFRRSPGDLREKSHTDFYADWGSKKVISKDEMQHSFSNHPILVKLKHAGTTSSDRCLANRQEVLDALGI